MSRYDLVVLAKEQTFTGRIIRGFLWGVILPMVKMIWIKEVRGLENIPKSGPYIIAANHQSYFDFISLMSIWPERPYFLAAEKFFTSSFWRPIVEYTGQIKVERQAEDKTDAINQALEYLKAGKIIAIFPQGTRSRNGEIEKVYTGVARLAIEAGVPIIPVGINGAYEVLPAYAKLPKFKKLIELNVGEPILFESDDETPENYKKITDHVMVHVAELAKILYIFD